MSCYFVHSYSAPNKATVPPGSLQYLLANTNLTYAIDDDGVEEGVNGTVGGFSSIYITKQNMTVKYHNQNGTVLYSSFVLPRKLGGSYKDDKLPMMYILIICGGGAMLGIVFAAGVYIFVCKARKSAGAGMIAVSTDDTVEKNPMTESVRNANTVPLVPLLLDESR